MNGFCENFQADNLALPKSPHREPLDIGRVTSVEVYASLVQAKTARCVLCTKTIQTPMIGVGGAASSTRASWYAARAKQLAPRSLRE